MATMNFSVPEDVKAAFNAAFDGQNKSAVITQLMREAVARLAEQRQRQVVVAEILAARAQAPVVDAAVVRQLRDDGRP